MKTIDINEFWEVPWRLTSHDVEIDAAPTHGSATFTKMVDGVDITLEADWTAEWPGPHEGPYPYMVPTAVRLAPRDLVFRDGADQYGWDSFDVGSQQDVFDLAVADQPDYSVFFEEPSVARTAAMQPGMLVNELEGHDLGDEGAVVTKVHQDGTVDLLRLDTEEIISDVQLRPEQYSAEEPIETQDPGPWGYDEEALGNDPDLHSIRELPLWRGPRDPNNPSTMTDVTWRPSPIWRRQLHRYYDQQGKIEMKYRRRPRFYKADPYVQMDPIPRPMGATMPHDDRLQTDYGLPRRMQLNRWAESKDDAFDTEALVAHTHDFWSQYRAKRISYSAEYGNRIDMDLRDWALMYQASEGLDRSEMDLLYRFMVATTLIPVDEYRAWRDVLDTYQVHRYHRS